MRYRWPFALVTVGVVVLSACRGPAPAAPPSSGAPGTSGAASSVVVAIGEDASPEDALRALVAAINGGDRPRAEALFGAQASWERGGQCGPGQCVGIPRLRQEIERDIANRHELELLSVEAAGDTATGRVGLRTNQTRAAGVERIVQIFTVKVAGGEIVALQARNDLTDAVTAEFARQRAKQ